MEPLTSVAHGSTWWVLNIWSRFYGIIIRVYRPQKLLSTDLLTVHHNIIIMSDLPVLTGAIQNSKLRNWMKINTCSFPAMWEKKYHQYMISDNYQKKKYIYIYIYTDRFFSTKF